MPNLVISPRSHRSLGQSVRGPKCMQQLHVVMSRFRSLALRFQALRTSTPCRNACRSNNAGWAHRVEIPVRAASASICRSLGIACRRASTLATCRARAWPNNPGQRCSPKCHTLQESEGPALTTGSSPLFRRTVQVRRYPDCARAGGFRFGESGDWRAEGAPPPCDVVCKVSISSGAPPPRRWRV
jgi:hypothetical protein